MGVSIPREDAYLRPFMESEKRTTDLSLFSNPDFDAGAPFLIRGIWFFMNAIVFQTAWFQSYVIKRFLLRLFGAKIGKKVVIKPSVNIKYPWKLRIGDFSWVGEKVWIDNLENVSLGAHCCLSQGSMLLTGNHDYSVVEFSLKASAIVLEDGAWVGARAVVCPGVTLGSHAVLSVGSVATRSLPPYTISSGNPATVIRERTIQ